MTATNSTPVYTPKRDNAKSVSARALGKVAASLNIKVTTTKDLAKHARIGLTTTSFECFARKGFTRKEMDWIIPARTLSHRQKGGGRLTTEESDKLIRVAKIQALASEVLGSEEKAKAWLHKGRKMFDGLSAMELIKTELGAQEVEEVLISIDEGYF